MDHAVNIWVVLEDLVETGFLSDIDVVELWPLAADELDTVDDLLRSIVKIVCDHNFVICFKECERGERTNVAATTINLLAYGTPLNGVFLYAPRDEY